MEVLNEGIITTTKDVAPETEVYEKEPAKIPGYIPNLDICFMLDCTGSMQKYIDRARNKIKDIIEEVKEQYPESEIQVGIVGYRDFDVSNDKRFEIFPFSSNIPSARSFLDSIRAHGGKDYPEDVNGGFQQVLNKMEWSGQAKMIVHIADAPCHGKQFHNSSSESYPDGHKADMDWELIFKKIVDQHMDYLFLKIQNGTDKMFDKFKEIAEKQGATANGVLFKQEQIANLDSTTTATVAPTTSLTTTAPLFVPKAIVTELAKVTVKPDIVKKEKKEVKKTRAPRTKSRKASPTKTPSRSRSRSTKTTKKERKTSRKRVEKEEEEVVVGDWAAPTHWTRSKYREYIDHGGKEQKKDGYWTIPQTEATEIRVTRSRSSKKSSARKPSISKERSEKRGKKRTEKSTKRKASTSKDRERSEERTKKTGTRRNTRSRSKKGGMTVENPLPKRAFIAPQSKTLSKAPVPVMPTSFVGMSAMDEQEYFAKLLSKEMMGSINRKIDVMK